MGNGAFAGKTTRYMMGPGERRGGGVGADSGISAIGRHPRIFRPSSSPLPHPSSPCSPRASSSDYPRVLLILPLLILIVLLILLPIRPPCPHVPPRPIRVFMDPRLPSSEPAHMITVTPSTRKVRKDFKEPDIVELCRERELDDLQDLRRQSGGGDVAASGRSRIERASDRTARHRCVIDDAPMIIDDHR